MAAAEVIETPGGASTDADWALRIAAVDLAGIGGVRLRAAAGQGRDEWLAALRAALPEGAPWRRVPSHIGDERLLGGIDLAATLRDGHLVTQPGVLAQAHGGAVILAMAERCDAGVASRIAQVLDAGSIVVQRAGVVDSQPARIGVIALDEAGADDAPLPGALAERLGIDLRLAPSRPRLDAPPVSVSATHREAVERARALLPQVAVSDAILTALCEAAQAMAIDSLRAPSLACRVACIVAALEGRREVGASDAALAARLVLGPRARAWPRNPESSDEEAGQEHADADAEPSQEPAADPAQESAREPAGEPPSESAASDRADDAGEPRETPAQDEAMSEQVLEAAAASLPAALLASIAAGTSAARTAAAAAGRSGAARRSAVRGRPLGSARGELRGGARLDLMATLRAAAPWQAMRRRESTSSREGFLVRSDDFHVRRFRERRESTTVFAVDASGSQALNRLAETKGAVELLLADCYVRRDRVAVIAFRGAEAQVLLAPTRSLVHARRSLAGLPGGGGTPLASGLVAARELAATILRDGGTPLLILLTDGSANVALDGSGGRERAFADALATARAWATIGVNSLVIDTAPRAQEKARTLASAMNGRYVALPNADAHALAKSIAGSGRAS
jgi:magnesium chelatase subunit D